MAAMAASVAALAICYARAESRLGARGWVDMVEEIAKQSAQVAVPIIAIGIIIAVAIQSNLALKFSTQLIELSGGTLIGAMLMIIVGCIVMGMGLPTVAAYIIGAILFVPALTKLGIDLLAAHFFVMYYCVLSMITPPVALASYAAAGLAKADAMKTGWIAFKLSLVLFLIPFAFAFDPALLWSGPLGWIALAFASMMAATFAWAVFLEGYVTSPVGWVERLAFCAVALAIIFAPTGHPWWWAGCAGFAALMGWTLLVRPRLKARIGVTAKGKVSASESRWLRDEATGARIRQVTSHPSIHHHPFFFVPPWDRAMRRLVFVSHRAGAPQLFAEELEIGPARAAHRPGRPRRVVVLSVARRAARLLRRRHRRVAPRPGDARRGPPRGFRRGRDARARHGRRSDGHHRALRRRPLVGGAGEARQGLAVLRHRHGELARTR